MATTPERLAELHRRHGWATAWGVEAQLLDAAETRRAAPAARPRPVLGGAARPHRRARPRRSRAVEAQTRRASRARRAVAATGTRCWTSGHADGRVTGVVTDQGEIPADIVVCCAGIWGPKVARHGRA